MTGVDGVVDDVPETELDDRTTADRARARELFAELAETQNTAIRDELVKMHLPLVEYLARRFRNRGEPLEDLVQVARLGLIKAVDRWDPDRGNAFTTFAT